MTWVISVTMVHGSRWSRGSHCIFWVNFDSGTQGHAGHVVTLYFFNGNMGHTQILEEIEDTKKIFRNYLTFNENSDFQKFEILQV